MMLSQRWIVLLFITGIATALGPIPRQPGEESLRSALDAVTRKQRSLDGNSQDYYNDLRSFKYHGGEPERKFERERQGEREMDVEDEEMEFLPNDAGQLETVGNDCQGLNSKLIERALIDSIDTAPEQEEPVTSLFRERERSSSRKRGNGYGNSYGNLNDYGSPNGYDNVNVDNNGNEAMVVDDPKWLKFLIGALNEQELLADKDYQKMLPDRYKLRKVLGKQALFGGQNREVDDVELPERDQEQSILYLAPAERRNVNGRYPIGRDMRTYRSLVKRYPVAKRSPKALPIKKQITDPKVAQDLGALFGPQSTDDLNRTHGHDHEHDHDHDHNHDHDHSHVHDHERIEQHEHDNSSEASTVTPVPKGQKEDARKVGKSETIEVRKKSIDWSQYFGIDRRRKKAVLTPGQGTQNQDDEWMLQRYSENMAENLKPNEREYEWENGERREYYDQPDSKKEELLRKLISRIADNISFKNLCDTFMYLRGNSRENRTSNTYDNVRKNEDKRNGNGLEEIEGIEDDGTNCPELRMIEQNCEIVNDLTEDPQSRLLYRPCVMVKICLACRPRNEMKSCRSAYMAKMGIICQMVGLVAGEKAKRLCVVRSSMMSLRVPQAALQCRLDGDSCLQRYYSRYLRHDSYGGQRSNDDNDSIDL